MKTSVQIKIIKKSAQKGLWLTVKSSSMQPIINQQNQVFIQSFPFHKLQNYDIISYWNHNDIITHRVIKISEKNITTKADTVKNKDKPIKPSQIIGKVLKIKKNRITIKLNNSLVNKINHLLGYYFKFFPSNAFVNRQIYKSLKYIYPFIMLLC